MKSGSTGHAERGVRVACDSLHWMDGRTRGEAQKGTREGGQGGLGRSEADVVAPPRAAVGGGAVAGEGAGGGASELRRLPQPGRAPQLYERAAACVIARAALPLRPGEPVRP